jgi:DNA primase catalytic core
MDPDEAREYSESWESRKLELEVKQEHQKKKQKTSPSPNSPGEIRDRIKNSLDVVNVIGKSISLHHDGNGEYHGATSASSKSGASLKVNFRMQLYNNFATGDGGDVFNWMAYENGLDCVDDFPKILRMAAEMAGIPLEEATPDDIKKAEERQTVQDILTEAATIYHGNVTPEIREYIHKKWSINDETIDMLKIGYAKPDSNLSSMSDRETILKSGLLLRFSNGGIKDFFLGRIVFPYWKNGKVVNFAARGDQDKLGTPNTEYEQAKYKKLLTHNDKHPYVSECVDNSYIWGEDTARGQDYCVITEGIADAIVLMQNGIPVLSPVTTKFAKHDIDKLVNISKRLKTVYIANDNEKSGAGEDGVLRTGAMLIKEGVDVRIIKLPLPEGLDKIDIAEYFINNPVKDFKTLMDSSIPYYQYIISQLPKSDNQTVNINTANQFLEKLTSLPIDVIDNLINHEIKNRFDFNRDDCRNLKRYFKRTKAENKDEHLSDLFNKYTPPFAEVANSIMECRAFFTFDDTKEIYVYRNGVYVSKGAETEIKQLARDRCCQMYEEHGLPPIVPSMTYVSEILELIRVRTAVYRDEIDNNPKNKYIINMKNGLYNITTGELTAHTEEYISLRQIPVDYDPTANAPKFRKFMSEIVTPEDAQVLLEFIGYSLFFDMKHDQAIMLQGIGANGKSILLQFIIALHGEENICSTSLQRLCEDRFALSELYGKPLNVFADLSDDGIKDDAMFKNVSSGDMITAQKKFGQPFQFRNTARQIYSVNDVPPVHKKTFAFFRRWILLCFPYTFVDNPAPDTNERKKDKGLKDALLTQEELSGAFNLTIDCMKHMLGNGKYSYASTVADVTELYTLKSDPVKAFTDRYTDASEYHIPVQEMYDGYVRWSKYKGLKILTAQRITRRLKNLGFVESRPYDDYGSRIYAWVNVSFTDDFDKEIPAEIKNEQKK